MNDRVNDFLKVISVWVVGGLSWLLTLSNLDLVLKIILSLIAISYGLWRWIRDYKKEK